MEDTRAFHEFERAGWENVAAEYDRRFGELTSQSIPPLLDAVGAAPGVRLLDVACGPGYVAAAAQARGARAVGIDFSAVMVAEALVRELLRLAGGRDGEGGDRAGRRKQHCSHVALL